MSHSPRRRIFPREHGSYAVLIASMAVGSLRMESHDILGLIAYVISISVLFVAQEPLKALMRRNPTQPQSYIAHLRQGTYLLIIGGIALCILCYVQPTCVWILPLAVIPVAGVLYTQIKRRSLFVRSLAGFALLTLAVPLAVLLGGAPIDAAISAWIEVLLFFLSAAIAVNLRLDASSVKSASLFFLIALSGLIIGATFELCSITSAIAFSLSTIRFLWVTRNIQQYHSFSLKQIGMQETAGAILLVALYSLA
jgi:hypothetical protein